MTKQKPKYNGGIVAGALLVRESRIIARLLLDEPTEAIWRQAIVIDNVLQKRSPASAQRQARLIKARLTLMEPELWRLIDRGSSDVIAQALLAAAIKHSALLGDFMAEVVKSHWRVFKKQLSTEDWRDYLETCAQLEPHIQKWTHATRAKLKQVVFRILAEAKYIDNTRSLALLPVSLTPEIKSYLLSHGEDYVLKCMESTP